MLSGQMSAEQSQSTKESLNNGESSGGISSTTNASTVIQSRRPRPAATAVCKECGVKMEYSLPASAAASSSSSLQVACFSCCHVNSIADADIHLIHDGTFRKEEQPKRATTDASGAAGASSSSSSPPPLPNRNAQTKSKPSTSSPSFAGFGGKTGSGNGGEVGCNLEGGVANDVLHTKPYTL